LIMMVLSNSLAVFGRNQSPFFLLDRQTPGLRC
jgi:hypothetical protein